MDGLDNPRGLAFGPEGGLYVAEAGRGGDAPCQTLLQPPDPPRCFGTTGAVTRLWRGVQERVLAGLPSHRNQFGQDANGPNDVGFIGRGAGYLTIGSGGNPALRGNFGPQGALLGTIIQFTPGGQYRVVADIGSHEAESNPSGGPIDSNAFGLLAQAGTLLVADAGANAVVIARPNGDVSTLGIFPSRPARPTDSVPTSVVLGPDGAYYVGELTGAPFAPNVANIYRIVPGSPPEVRASGFQTIIDLDFGPDGSLYVLQHATGVFFSGPGSVIRVAPDGSRAPVIEGLIRPTSLVVGDSGSIYVTNHAVSIGGGEVWRFSP
jgi:hypothetical protein